MNLNKNSKILMAARVLRGRQDVVQRENNMHFNENRQSKRAKVSREQMYEMRWNNEFAGWSEHKISVYYGLDKLYVRRKVIGYETMAGLVPEKGKRTL